MENDNGSLLREERLRMFHRRNRILEKICTVRHECGIKPVLSEQCGIEFLIKVRRNDLAVTPVRFRLHALRKLFQVCSVWFNGSEGIQSLRPIEVIIEHAVSRANAEHAGKPRQSLENRARAIQHRPIYSSSTP